MEGTESCDPLSFFYFFSIHSGKSKTLLEMGLSGRGQAEKNTGSFLPQNDLTKGVKVRKSLACYKIGSQALWLKQRVHMEFP